MNFFLNNKKLPIFLVFFLVLLAKVIFFCLDRQVMLFYGDSLQYLKTAATGEIPLDRSWIYGKVIDFLIFNQSFDFLILVQVIFAFLSALLFYFCVVRFFACYWLGAVLAVFLACEPLTILYERMIMCEIFGIFCWVCFLVLCSWFYFRRSFLILIAIHFFGILAVALRSIFLPSVFLIGLFLPLIILFCQFFNKKKAMEHFFFLFFL